MMKSAILATTIASACAFAPTPVAQTSTSLAATAAQTDFFGLVEEVDFTKEVGVLPPVSSLLCISSSTIYSIAILNVISHHVSLFLFNTHDMYLTIQKLHYCNTIQ